MGFEQRAFVVNIFFPTIKIWKEKNVAQIHQKKIPQKKNPPNFLGRSTNPNPPPRMMEKHGLFRVLPNPTVN